MLYFITLAFSILALASKYFIIIQDAYLIILQQCVAALYLCSSLVTILPSQIQNKEKSLGNQENLFPMCQLCLIIGFSLFLFLESVLFKPEQRKNTILEIELIDFNQIQNQDQAFKIQPGNAFKLVIKEILQNLIEGVLLGIYYDCYLCVIVFGGILMRSQYEHPYNQNVKWNIVLLSLAYLVSIFWMNRSQNFYVLSFSSGYMIYEATVSIVANNYEKINDQKVYHFVYFGAFIVLYTLSVLL